MGQGRTRNFTIAGRKYRDFIIRPDIHQITLLEDGQEIVLGELIEVPPEGRAKGFFMLSTATRERFDTWTPAVLALEAYYWRSLAAGVLAPQPQEPIKVVGNPAPALIHQLPMGGVALVLPAPTEKKPKTPTPDGWLSGADMARSLGTYPQILVGKMERGEVERQCLEDPQARNGWRWIYRMPPAVVVELTPEPEPVVDDAPQSLAPGWYDCETVAAQMGCHPATIRVRAREGKYVARRSETGNKSAKWEVLWPLQAPEQAQEAEPAAPEPLPVRPAVTYTAWLEQHMRGLEARVAALEAGANIKKQVTWADRLLGRMA